VAGVIGRPLVGRWPGVLAPRREAAAHCSAPAVIITIAAICADDRGPSSARGRATGSAPAGHRPNRITPACVGCTGGRTTGSASADRRPDRIITAPHGGSALAPTSTDATAARDDAGPAAGRSGHVRRRSPADPGGAAPSGLLPRPGGRHLGAGDARRDPPLSAEDRRGDDREAHGGAGQSFGEHPVSATAPGRR